MFDPDAPVFRTDEYDRAGLPLPIELSVSFSAVGAPAPADAELADYLLKTKAVCEETGQPFAYYSVALAFKPTEQKDRFGGRQSISRRKRSRRRRFWIIWQLWTAG